MPLFKNDNKIEIFEGAIIYERVIMGRPKVDPNDRFNTTVVKRFQSKTERKENGCLEYNKQAYTDGINPGNGLKRVTDSGEIG